MYAKLVDGNLVFAPKCFPVGAINVWNPTPEMLETAGYKPVIFVDPPEPREGYSYESIWEEQNGEIIQVWIEQEMPDEIDEAEKLPLEERQKILAGFEARNNSEEGKKRFNVQCKLGAPESNIDWQEVKNALDEQDFEAFWIVEREGFYDEHDKCIAEDCAWLKEHIK